MMNSDAMSETEHALNAVLERPDLNGVYRLPQAGFDFKPVLDGRELLDKHAFLAAIGRAFNFPAYYGENWDALEECLGDMSWHTGPVALLIEQADAIPASVMSIFLDIFSSIAEYWAAQERGCSLFLSGFEDADIPLLV